MLVPTCRETFNNAPLEVLPDQEVRRNSVVEAQSCLMMCPVANQHLSTNVGRHHGVDQPDSKR